MRHRLAIVVLGVAVYAWRVRGNRHALATWRHVTHDAPAMAAAVVLGVFIVIALLDSIHFRPRLPAAPGAAADAPAAYATRTRNAELLLQAGADPLLKTNIGRDVLSMARKVRADELAGVVSLWILKGCKPGKPC